jgi:hypothetical protein
LGYKSKTKSQQQGAILRFSANFYLWAAAPTSSSNPKISWIQNHSNTESKTSKPNITATNKNYQFPNISKTITHHNRTVFF